MTGLTKEQISITDTNQSVEPLKIYPASDIPLHLGIVLVATQKTFAQQQAAAIELVKRAVRANVDAAFVVSSKGKKPWPGEHLDWSSDPEKLTKQIQELDPNAGLGDPFSFDLDTTSTEFVGGRMTLQYYGSEGGPDVFRAAFAMMSSDPRPARRVLVMFREPWAHSAGFGNRVTTAVDNTVTSVTQAAQKMHVSIFAIGLEDSRFNGITDNTIGNTYISLHAGDEGGAGAGQRKYDAELERQKLRAYNGGRTNVERLAAETGGAVIWSTKKNYPDAVNSIANLVAGQYIVTFIPADSPGPVHTLKIISNGGKVLAQPAFFTAANRSEEKPVPPPTAPNGLTK